MSSECRDWADLLSGYNCSPGYILIDASDASMLLVSLIILSPKDVCASVCQVVSLDLKVPAGLIILFQLALPFRMQWRWPRL